MTIKVISVKETVRVNHWDFVGGGVRPLGIHEKYCGSYVGWH